eukprot:1289165-Pyramimonas_sp.AAC.1
MSSGSRRGQLLPSGARAGDAAPLAPQSSLHRATSCSTSTARSPDWKPTATAGAGTARTLVAR